MLAPKRNVVNFIARSLAWYIINADHPEHHKYTNIALYSDGSSEVNQSVEYWEIEWDIRQQAGYTGCERD